MVTVFLILHRKESFLYVGEIGNVSNKLRCHHLKAPEGSIHIREGYGALSDVIKVLKEDNWAIRTSNTTTSFMMELNIQ